MSRGPVNLQKFPHCPIMRREEAEAWIGSGVIIAEAVKRDDLKPIPVGRAVYFQTKAVHQLAQRIAESVK